MCIVNEISWQFYTSGRIAKFKIWFTKCFRKKNFVAIQRIYGIDFDFDCQSLSAIPTIDKCKMSKAFWTVCF